MNRIKAETLEANRCKANHEAGHYILARHFKFETNGMTIMIENDEGHHAASSVIKLDIPLVGNDQIIKYCEERIQILYSGGIAESLHNGKTDPDVALQVWFNGGKSDFEKLKEVMRVLRNIKHPATLDEKTKQIELDEIDKDLIAKSGALVEKYHKVIYRLGDLLLSKAVFYNIEGKLTEEEINKMPDIIKLFPPTKL